MRPCETCGSLHQINSDYCSRGCQEVAAMEREHYKETRICPNCSDDFVPDNQSVEEFCCRACYGDFMNHMGELV